MSGVYRGFSSGMAEILDNLFRAHSDITALYTGPSDKPMKRYSIWYIKIIFVCKLKSAF